MASPSRSNKSSVVSSTPWKGPLRREKDLLPWDISKVEEILKPALAPRASVETVLRAANTMRRCIENADEAGLDLLRANRLVFSSILFFLSLDDGTPTCSRIHEHCVICCANLLGATGYNEQLALDPSLLHFIERALADKHIVTVAAAAQWIRRVSEFDEVSQIIVFEDVIFLSIVQLVESASDGAVLSHLLSALINLAASPKANFVVARCSRLTRRLMELIFNGFSFGLTTRQPLDDYNPERRKSISTSTVVANRLILECATKSVKIFANLLSFQSNRFEIRSALGARLLDAMVECQHQNVSSELVSASKLIVDFLHDGDDGVLRNDLAAELTEGVKYSGRVRSSLARTPGA
jgi:hypothetical protein